MKDILVDVTIEMPGLLEALDNLALNTSEDSQHALQQDIVKRCWEYDSQLLRWHSFLSSDRAFCDYIVPSETSVESSSALEYAKLEGMSMLWATCLVLYSTLRSVSGDLSNLPSRTNLQQYAEKLVEAIPVLIQPSAGYYGRDIAALPLALALVVTVRTKSLSKEHALLMENLKGMPRKIAEGLFELVSSAEA
jgi:hypothetical protein